ncbi:GNAT family N-acetyltransferase [Flammeovirga pacifica]|uniref:N-acetyltransferase domain-containing protein n=1 Tax=Flammeovirga pacifica TaxID=915059 RepID=A0A1S1Z165_FLAPC|nr:GNAT family N-acetyltransferase [Flammeovirga pacifica]OHX67014.1 hypothetical protein NH26_12000 [Flammeovirga pacifica]
MKKIEYSYCNSNDLNVEDIKEIIELLNCVFTDPLMPFTYKWFKWKFIQNPFGPSFCFIAKNNGSIIGVRFLWAWQFHAENRANCYYQAVDSAVSKKFRGQGIFKKLNQMIIDFANEKKYFIYNFPNENSYPIYKKMGWIDLIENTYWEIFPTVPFFNLGYKYLFKNFKTKNNIISTNWSDNIIQWRFIDHPYFNYNLYKINNSSICIVYQIHKGIINRVEIILKPLEINYFEFKQFIKHLKKTIGYFFLIQYTSSINFGVNNWSFRIRKKSRLNYVLKEYTGSENKYQFFLQKADMDCY